MDCSASTNPFSVNYGHSCACWTNTNNTCFQIVFFTSALNTHISCVLWTLEYLCLLEHKLKRYWTFYFQALPQNYLLQILRLIGNKYSCTENPIILLQLTLTGLHIVVIWKPTLSPVCQSVTPDDIYWEKCCTKWVTVSSSLAVSTLSQLKWLVSCKDLHLSKKQNEISRSK
jgi:hypothetical protein